MKPQADRLMHKESAARLLDDLAAANARIAELEREQAEERRLHCTARVELTAANARAEAAEEDKRCERDLRVQAESEADDLRAEVERLQRLACDTGLKASQARQQSLVEAGHAIALEDRLAAANAEVERLREKLTLTESRLLEAIHSEDRAFQRGVDWARGKLP